MTKISKLLPRSVSFYVLLLVISTGMILYGTLTPSNDTLSSFVLLNDKFVHFLMFLIWTFFFGIIRILKGNDKLLPIFLTGSAFGLIIELLQYVLPTQRQAELLDMIADVAGVVVALALLRLLIRWDPDFRSS